MVRIGAALREGAPLAAARAAHAEVGQFFRGDAGGWKAPTFRGEPTEVRAAFAAAGVDAYIHAPYVINVASPNNRIRIPSRKLLEQQLTAAAEVGAKGLIVHGGYVTAGVDPEEGYESWRKAVQRIERPLPMLIENTAGGDGAMARSYEAIARLWEGITDAAGGGGEAGSVVGASAARSSTPAVANTAAVAFVFCAAPPVGRGDGGAVVLLGEGDGLGGDDEGDGLGPVGGGQGCPWCLCHCPHGFGLGFGFGFGFWSWCFLGLGTCFGTWTHWVNPV